MHLEFLIEDQSGKIALDGVLKNYLREGETYSIHPYKGIGQIPKGMKAKQDPSKRILLNQLPRLLKGYGEVFSKYPAGYKVAVIVICDLDGRNLHSFLGELYGVLNACTPKPETKFCISIEEGEAWLLGHTDAVKTAYPNAKDSVLSRYVYDSICGTWEVLADAVYPGGARSLSKKGKMEVGRMKSIWAKEIAPLIDVEENKSPSFQFLIRTIDDFRRANV